MTAMIYKEYLQFHNKKRNGPIKNKQKFSTNISEKKHE